MDKKPLRAAKYAERYNQKLLSLEKTIATRRSLVGQIPAVCPATLTRANTYVSDPKLKVSPEQAVTAAEAAGRIRCNSKVLQEVFADSENYYVTRFGSETVVVVNGNTAAVTVREQK
jgi:hypothetical protein